MCEKGSVIRDMKQHSDSVPSDHRATDKVLGQMGNFITPFLKQLDNIDFNWAIKKYYCKTWTLFESSNLDCCIKDII